MNIKNGFIKLLTFGFLFNLCLAFVCGSLPDLTITQVQMVNDCYIDVTIKNTGQAGLQVSQYSQVIVQLRLNGSSWAGGRLTTFASSGELSSPGGTLVIHKLYNKRVPDGLHTVEVAIDPLNFITESDDNNNSMAVSLTGSCNVAPPGGKPNLTLKNLTLGKNCHVAFTIENNGDIGVPNHAFTGTAVHLYKNNVILASKMLGEIDPGKNLSKPGGSVNFSYGPTVNIGTGSSQIKVHLNLNFIDKNTTDNTIIKSLNCKSSASGSSKSGKQGATSLPDLKVTNIKMIANCYFEVTIKNLGGIGLLPDQYYKTIVQLRLDGKNWAGGRLTSYASGGALSSPGGILKIQKLFNKQVPDGKHTVEVQVDPLNYLNESNNSNNNKSISVNGNCGITPPGSSDVKVFDLRLNNNCQVEVTLKNIGTAGVPAGNFASSNVHLYKNNQILISKNLATVDPQKLLNQIGGSVKYTFKQGANIGQGGQIKITVVPTFKDKNSMNNHLTRSLQCGTPDLTIFSINEEKSLKGRKQKKYRVTVKNIGDKSSPRSVLRVDVGSRDKNRDYKVRSLSPGSSQRIIVQVSPRIRGRTGITFKVDPDNLIKELREDNNIKKK